MTLDSKDLRKLTIDSLREQRVDGPAGGVPLPGDDPRQHPLRKPEATDHEVEQVCRLLAIHEAILRMPNGYDTEVRERGAALSGGERQLIALARAVLVDPRLLILDEATSALDAATEAHVESRCGSRRTAARRS